MTEDEIRSLADDVLRASFGRFGFDHAEVRADLDHDGEPALFVDAIFRPGSIQKDRPAFADAFGEALGALRDSLLDGGENRFPYLLPFYPDDEFAEDESLSEEART